jgi:hypothetical protein
MECRRTPVRVTPHEKWSRGLSKKPKYAILGIQVEEGIDYGK